MNGYGDDDLTREVHELLKIHPGTSRVASREGTRLEFKQSFSFAGIAEYLRTLAAFANFRGGFIVFGVADSPRDLIGIDGERFDNIDIARFTTHANSHLAPSIEWSHGVTEVEGHRVGFLHVKEHVFKPVMCIGDGGEALREGDIYYRYRGQTRRIRYPELQEILDARLERERKAWRDHLVKVADAGPTNVAVLDLIEGRMEAGGHTFLIDDRLAAQLSFIREGSFDERYGDPTLRLVGDVEPAGVVSGAKRVPMVVQFHDLIARFLANSQMSTGEARAYLRAAMSQNSVYVPIHFFIQQSGLTRPQVRERLDDIPGLGGRHRDEIWARIIGERPVKPIGAVHDPLPEIEDLSDEELEAGYEFAETQKAKRSMILSALRRDPQRLLRITDVVEVSRVTEAITHLEKSEVKEHASVLRQLLMGGYWERFDDLDDPVKTNFRKAIAHIDDLVYGVEG